jgi:hypothetical protein
MKCANCGREGNRGFIICPTENDTSIAFCIDCYKLFGTCAMCTHTYCGFFNDPDPMPQFKTVMHQTKQGNAVYIEQKQVPNPDRVRKFCTDGKCKCFLDDPKHPLCCRHGGYATCSNYTEQEYKKFVENFPVETESEN